jgi:hypothetical protein
MGSQDYVTFLGGQTRRESHHLVLCNKDVILNRYYSGVLNVYTIYKTVGDLKFPRAASRFTASHSCLGTKIMTGGVKVAHSAQNYFMHDR